MKRFICVITVLGILMLACNVVSSATPAAATDTPTARPPVESTDTLTPEEPAEATEAPATPEPEIPTDTPAPTEEPQVQANVVCNEVSFYLDPALASDYNCETVQESIGEIIWDIYPQYTKITLQGYVLSDRFFEPYLSVYPLPRYQELAPDVIPGSVTALNALIGGGAPPEGSLPQVGLYGAAQEFHAQYQLVPFANGNGIRYLTQYAQYYAPINNHDMFYTYQGMTADGQYWISAIVPMSHPLLPADPSILPEGATVDNFGDIFVGYIGNLTNQLNTQAPESFIPSLTALDQMVASIEIHP